jgi:ferredoxin-nitrate reductase
MKNTTTYKSTCSYCGVGCGIVIEKDAKGNIEVTGDADHPVNRGMLCSKGRNLHHVVMDKTDRLLYPQMRWNKYAPLQRASWDTALDRTAAVFKTFINKYGPDSVGLYVSGQLLTEEYYVANKLTKGFLGTNNIDTNSRLCMSSAVVGYKQSLGEDSVPLSYEDIELADCFFITGANPAWCHPILFRRLEAHKAANPHIKIITVDPRRTQTAAASDIHLQINPGTDIWLYHAIARWLIETGNIDHNFILNHTQGFDKLKEKVMEHALSEAANICGISESDITETAKLIANAKGFISMWAMGLNQSVIGVDKNTALINLSLITGKIGKPGNGPFSLTGQPNAMGGRETGGLSNLLPAHRNLDNAEHRQEVADFWGVPSLSAKPGFTATQMFDALADGRMKAIWIICTNPLVSLPNARVVEEALKKARFVVVQDISGKNEACAYADVILPAAGWAEKEGTMTNSERRITLLQKAVNPAGEARPDTDILCDFAQRMGYPGFGFKSAGEVFAEHAQLTKNTNIDISGLSYEHLQKNGSAQWPFPSGAHNGTARLFTDHQFYTPTGLANIIAAEPENGSEPVSDKFPLVMTTGRIRDQWHTMTRTGKVQRLKQHIADPFLEIHPIDAEKRGIKQDDLAVVKSEFGEIRVRANLTSDIKPGVVFTPMHWGKALQGDLTRANNLTSTLIDPKSKEPDFKFTAVDVHKYIKKKERILVIGAGAASYQLVKTLREMGSNDTITVLSDEKHPFYNRVLLPDYINGTKNWAHLQKSSSAEIESLNIKLLTETRAKHIDTEHKVVTDSKDTMHIYDKLVLATGSRPSRPNGINMNLPNIFTVRSKEDADKIIATLTPGDKVVVAGAGLLGLEMVAALCETGIQTCIINRVSKLMSRQLDNVAAELLKEIVEEHGTEIFSNDEIDTIAPGNETALTVYLKSGKQIACKAVIYGIGTTPNIELAKEAGIAVQRGVIVNDYLETGCENVFAIGEIAQHNDTLYGITMVAEEQATVLAKYLMGDVSSTFNGSVSMNILKYPGIELCSLGLCETPHNANGYEEIVFTDKAARYYKKCIVHNQRLVGAILLGDKAEFTEFKNLIKNGTELSDLRLKLLRSGKTAEPVIGKVVCSCNNVGEGNILSHIKNNNTDFGQLCMATGAGTGCGSCKPEVKAILEKQLALTETA